jgi:hypothetical protein
VGDSLKWLSGGACTTSRGMVATFLAQRRYEDNGRRLSMKGAEVQAVWLWATAPPRDHPIVHGRSSLGAPVVTARSSPASWDAMR